MAIRWIPENVRDLNHACILISLESSRPSISSCIYNFIVMMGGIPKEIDACMRNTVTTVWTPWPHLPRCSTVVAGELGVVSEWFSSHGVTFFFSLSTAGEYDL
jgi:hypothetical protein